MSNKIITIKNLEYFLNQEIPPVIHSLGDGLSDWDREKVLTPVFDKLDNLLSVLDNLKNEQLIIDTANEGNKGKDNE
jgi:hypothetical protein